MVSVFDRVTLTVPDLKPLVEFFVELGNIITRFETKGEIAYFEQEIEQKLIP